jgi:hypothetical protein
VQALPRRLQQADLPEEADLRFSSTISPFFQRATVQNCSSNDLPVGGCTLPERSFHGPIIFPFHFAIVHVQSPEANITL